MSEDDKKTINGIGKSSSLNLIHLLMGGKFDSKSKSDMKFKEFLEGYGSFHLKFEVNETPYILTRNFKEDETYINDQEIKKTNLPKYLTNLVLGASAPKDISFKQAFNAFARRYESGYIYYSDALTQQGRPSNDYYQRLANLSLLGIDTELVAQKNVINEQLSSLKKTQTVLNEQKKLVSDDNVLDLQDSLDKLIRDRDAFIIAPNYDQFKAQADDLTSKLNEMRNDLYAIKKNRARKLRSINQSKSSDVDVDLQKVKSLYEQANFHFPQSVNKTLIDAQDFHKKLINSRISRMTLEIEQLTRNYDELNNELQLLEEKRDNILKDLNSVGALEEFNSIIDRIRSLEREIFDINKYDEMVSSLAKDKHRLELEKQKVINLSIDYLEENNHKLDTIEQQFRELVKRFYDNHGGSFKIKLADDAKYLFDIEVYVPRDKSQGINEVKIFCYDLLLFLLNRELLGFVAHDGCIFSEMDIRQKATIFKVVLEFIREYGLQYYINISTDSLDQICSQTSQSILSAEDIAEIKGSIILELSDKDPKSWLFGQQFG
ncbi:DUF2326 domain-containing protein [Erwinia sp. S59]|uniref:DUF2326 domain-containing protein n=1 Tax=Erwinia sp. S59 TaxID=2769340 RepID=UPI0019098C05|nr:DUF2326 domain-containing protein [Erwinia sp. S59]MBK0091787.1 DUF2326 domain-containing protein [Erwinia sp. S59]